MKRAKAKSDITLERLAQMVARGFSGQEKSFSEKIDGVEKRLDEKIDGVEKRLDEKIDGVEKRLSQQINGVNNRIDDLALNRATREELLVLDKRVERVEHKLGIDFKPRQHA